MADPVLKKGSKGDAVERLQDLLRNPLGYDPGPVDGIFGTGTEKAVKEYQANNGLTADGVVGPATWALLNVV